MTQTPSGAGSRLARWASGLRFPGLLALTAGLLLIDLITPDPIPWIDEVVLGLVALMLARLKKRRRSRDAASDSQASR